MVKCRRARIRSCGLMFWEMTLLMVISHELRADEPVAAKPAEKHWAYRPVIRPPVPDVQHKEQVITPIDAFLLARLEALGLSYSATASKEELLRRAKFDLHGLPPTPAEREQFLDDTQPRAFDRLIDRLLESPLYGERWGRMWLDVVRFADSAGYNADPLRPLAWQYRDYVIRSFNRDTPYNRFVQEQLAGDEMFPDQPEALIATGFNRLPPDESNASNILLARQDQLNDLTTAVGSIFLAQSLGCAQCHDHKFDAISQLDFYRIQAFFAGIVPVEEFSLGTPEQLADYEQRLKAWLATTAGPQAELHSIEQPALLKATQDKRLKFPAEVLAALDTPVRERTALQQQYCFFAERQMTVPDQAVDQNLTPEQLRRRAELKAELQRLLEQKPQPPRTVAATGTIDGPETPKTYLLAGGTYDKYLEEVQPGFLSAISDVVPATITPPRPGTPGRRTALANWLVDPANPLPARVLINRLWQGHFSTGLAENANDFGVQGRSPKHLELLDWLATELVSQGWSMKAMHRLIMTSCAYRQATEQVGNASPARITADPGNLCYGHFDRHRLDAESLRDSLLAVSGLLNVRMGGPGVRPELPPNFKGRDWDVNSRVEDRQRRSIYILAKRNLPYPFLQTFDLPDTFESCARRQTTNTGLQALTLLNSDAVLRYAQAFAGRLLSVNPSADSANLVQLAYILAYAREPRAEETTAALRFLELQMQVISPRQAANEPLLLPQPFPKFQDPVRGAALVDFCHAIFNSNEFLYID